PRRRSRGADQIVTPPTATTAISAASHRLMARPPSSIHGCSNALESERGGGRSLRHLLNVCASVIIDATRKDYIRRGRNRIGESWRSVLDFFGRTHVFDPDRARELGRQRLLWCRRPAC